jgi:hypothetical protein
MDKMLKTLNASFPLEEKPVGEFAKIKVKGMNFTIQQYYAKGLGNVSVMRAVGFFGLMKMDTLIINPAERDAPLFSYDRVLAMGNDTLILELYNTFLHEDGSEYKEQLEGIQKVNEAHKSLPDHDLGSHWYDGIKLRESASKKSKKKDSPSFDVMAQEYFKAYVESAIASDKLENADTETCAKTMKMEKASVYVEGLLSNGGPSTDIFKQYYGEEKTAYLFRKILFGTET